MKTMKSSLPNEIDSDFTNGSRMELCKVMNREAYSLTIRLSMTLDA